MNTLAIPTLTVCAIQGNTKHGWSSNGLEYWHEQKRYAHRHHLFDTEDDAMAYALSRPNTRFDLTIVNWHVPTMDRWLITDHRKGH
jgi:hypothetical protein